MKVDSYSLKARIMPAIFTIIIPIIIFNHFYVAEEFSKLVGRILGAKLLSNLSISATCLYFLSEYGRLIGKNVFEKYYYKEELYMPTTSFMLFKDQTYSDEYKLRIRQKVKKEFGITWLDKDQEFDDENKSRKMIVETMALIRKELKGNSFLFQHNVEYGAMRNAIGGAVLGAIFSLNNILFFKYVFLNDFAVNASIYTFAIYSFMVLSSKIVISFYGKNYAKILFREFTGE